MTPGDIARALFVADNWRNPNALDEWEEEPAWIRLPYLKMAAGVLPALADAWDEGATAQAAAYGMDKDTGANPYR